jgi:deazaflavin-dependent oxidoreductase (nitroreductase family)
MARSERTPTPEATLVQRLVRWGNAKLLNPPTLVALRLGIAPRAFALLETVGRRSGKRRLTPVGNGLIGNEFWLVAQQGLRAGYVRNLRANPRAWVKVGRDWYEGTAQLLRRDDWSARLDRIGAVLGLARVTVVASVPTAAETPDALRGTDGSQP